MSADVLRQAAALMRERAEAARPSPWRLGQWLPEDRDYEEQAQVYGGGRDGSEAFVVEGSFIDDAVHIASWHPAVALAVADWLDAVADTFENEVGVPEDLDAWPPFRVARAYLGESA